MQVEFKNEPFTNFSLPENRKAFEEALAKVESELGREYDLIIGGERIKTEKKSRSINPSNIEQVVGIVSQADKDLAEKAIQAAAQTFETWKAVPPQARSRYLYKAAAILRRRKHEFSAWLVKEAGKSWSEADADTAEAIDFMEYYGRQMDKLADRHPLTRIPDEDNELYYVPLGVGVVIPPWNFPLAIMVGMTTAALVAGNTVVLKPASTTPVIAAKFMEILEDAGVPAGVVNFVPGSGGEIGDYLVEHTQTRFISFTGSRDVGLRINELAAKHRPGQKWMKRLVAEMGGKDSIIVDNDCDLEAAAQAIVASAFGFSGQKCSACSRAIVHQDVYDQVLNRVVELTKQLTVGDVVNPEFYTGPVVDDKAQKKILEYIEIGKKEGKLMVGGEKGPDNGYYVMPTVFADLDPQARLMQEEIFGPVVGFCKAKDFDHALEIANNTEYGLTGSVFSRNRAHLEKARMEFHVGNLYFNRKCTGALVGVHPFGGFNMSGTDSKAGGPDYLLLFTQAKLVSEKL
ncbi:L-glutamate gamma-semialdehyde dehydrogenase [Brevibacillus composti]|uniref:L-glutamate gamma-semialdehyde dehydrogenase n=1 Tax=Brevibacillus composti TaxID=2796470 RepID=A0A7T5ELR6_9BACL|nr:L-glutamate gamma-semialdehyde dehydrogenase [Brevibacillus composti]QQE74965.1 L-glutamate gamma-semialdehyde dehydrogenase [Brevibacillus composti]QUO42049.1 L-glutamate gamma-semialdehyde dehydrogenase [Brevibacillus composti]